jgi:hypothetical protein
VLVHVFQSKETGRYLASAMNGSIETAAKPEHAIYWKYGERTQEKYFNTFIRTNKLKIEKFRLQHSVVDIEEVVL